MSHETFKNTAKGSPRSVESSDDDELPQEKVFTFDDVRITPSYMLFDNAYEGKHYKERLVIQNCGSRLAFIRLCEPNSKVIFPPSATKLQRKFCRRSSSHPSPADSTSRLG